MNDHDLDALLRALPRERASEGFTAKVVRAARRPRRRLSPARGLALAGAALVAVLALVVQKHHVHEGERAALRAEVRALRAAVGELEAGVDGPPLVYVGGDDRVDIVLDGRRLAERRGAVAPALYRGEEL